MAYDQDLANRFRQSLNAHMIGGADRTKTGARRLMFRVGKDNAAAAAPLPGGALKLQGGRKMTGFSFLDADKCTDDTCAAWLSRALDTALCLPEK